MAAQRNQNARKSTVNMTYSPSSDRALRAIADELRRIADHVAAPHNATIVTQALPSEPGATSALPAATPEATPAANPQEEALFQSLREWRAGEARKLGMPPYIVATDKVLRAVAQRRPAKVEELQAIPGFGPAKAAKYGSGLVQIVATA